MDPTPWWDVLLDDLTAIAVPILVVVIGAWIAARQRHTKEEVRALDRRNSLQHGENAALLQSVVAASENTAHSVVALQDTVNINHRQVVKRLDGVDEKLGAMESNQEDLKDWQVGHDALHGTLRPTG